jgi:hypothetical protein
MVVAMVPDLRNSDGWQRSNKVFICIARRLPLWQELHPEAVFVLWFDSQRRDRMACTTKCGCFDGVLAELLNPAGEILSEAKQLGATRVEVKDGGGRGHQTRAVY